MTEPTGRSLSISFEFFPPATPAGAMRLWRSVERLAPLAPSFVSVTYGAGGTTRDRTRMAIQAILERARLQVAGHLTCVGASREETLAEADGYRKLGARRVVALRGDPPKGAERFEPHPDGFRNAAELVAGLRAAGHERISVAAYPERHPDSADLAADLDNLKRKLDAGADSALTQFFFDNELFLRFRDAAAKAGIAAPIHPGILPIENFAKMRRFAAGCGASVPDWLVQAYENADDQGMTETLSRAICAEQCDGLRAEGVEHIHFYTLNNPDLPYDVCRALGVEPQPLGAASGSGAA
ncbi:MAG: methylenetetrahydrofolate reductase [NAD(P)H] [Pseudomonadota bacterium]|nr:methylenetetrahydrofolate reductase [NAD(P)H] [Pseudomonadota bacterium]